MRLHHLALLVANCERARAFYGDLLGLPEVRRVAGEGALHAVWLRAGDAVLMLERGLRGAGHEASSGHLLALAADDLPGWEARLDAAGFPIVDRTPHTLYVQDPDGHRVGLSSYPLP